MIDKDGNIVVDRSGVETRLLCKQKRFLSRDFDGTGITSPGGRYEADFGNVLHSALNDGMTLGYYNKTVCYTDVGRAVEHNLEFRTPAMMQHAKVEQGNLAALLLDKWLQERWPVIKLDFKLVESEVEHAVVFDPNKYLPAQLASIMRPVKMLFRPDTILKREDGLIFSMDFKTASRAGEDWSVHHSQSLQTYLYSAALREIYGDQYGGIWYEGLVKGYREVDNAKSSLFNGYTIQYGSPLYGWYNKTNPTPVKYASGCTRDFVFNREKNLTWAEFLERVPTSDILITTLPSNPDDTSDIVGQMIVNENAYQVDLDTLSETQPNSAQRAFYERVIFERNFHACYKYGAKHPCEFVRICHNGITRDEIAQDFVARVPHHNEQGEQ